MKTNDLVAMGLITATAVIIATLVWTLQDSSIAQEESCAALELSYLPNAFRVNVNESRVSALMVALNPWRPWNLTVPRIDVGFLRERAFELLNVNLILLNGTGPGGDLLWQHEKYPYAGRVGALYNQPLPLHGGTSTIIVTWNQPNETVSYALEWTLLHELAHSLGLPHNGIRSNLMFDSLTGVGKELNECQRNQLMHVFKA